MTSTSLLADRQN